ncbi:MAG: hypothetical protein H0W50_00830, partial [Parachlamydiaceae bacterium]|nr:hypothetical protein [Parachlamydiaceae bacterium]
AFSLPKSKIWTHFGISEKHILNVIKRIDVIFSDNNSMERANEKLYAFKKEFKIEDINYKYSEDIICNDFEKSIKLAEARAFLKTRAKENWN